MNLFRKEVTLSKYTKLSGQVLIIQPASHYALLLLLSLFIGLFLVLAFIGNFTRSEQAIGYLVPNKGLIKVYPTRAGTLSSLNISEGFMVKANDLLAIVNIEQSLTNGSSFQKKSIQTLNAQYDLLAQKSNLQKLQSKTKITKIENDYNNSLVALRGLRKRLSLQKEITKSSILAFERVKKLVSKGVSSKIEVEKRYQTSLNARQNLEILKQDIANIENKTSALENEKKQLTLLNQQVLNQIKSDQLSIYQRINELEKNRTYAITAPIAGKAVSILSSEGRLVTPESPLLTIIPEGGELIAELFVSSRASGFVKPGQDVRLVFEAFPYQKFGYIPAKIKSVSHTILSPEETGAPLDINDSVYRVIAKLNHHEIKVGNDVISLQPGMKLKATIVLEKITLIDFLLSPLKSIENRL